MKTKKCRLQSKGIQIGRFITAGAMLAAALLLPLILKSTASDGFSITPYSNGAFLKSEPQKLEGFATPQGLWITSTDGEEENAERFRVVASALGRAGEKTRSLSLTGFVKLESESVNFIRSGVTEEYRVSIDGIRQDFMVAQRPAGRGELRLDLEVTGAKAEPSTQEPWHDFGIGRAALPRRLSIQAAQEPFQQSGRVVEPRHPDLKAEQQHSPTKMRLTDTKPNNIRMQSNSGAKLRLIGSGREITYSRLRVFDAEGRTLPARMEVPDPNHLRVFVDDVAAVYPLRIDPIFSDDDWASMGGLPGASHPIVALLTDDAGNLYAGGQFTSIGDTPANRIAKWDGTDWSPLGSGVKGRGVEVSAMAFLDADLYVGGTFTLAGDKTVNHIAKWDGEEWSPLGTGMDSNHSIWISSLAVSGTNLYAAGWFDTAGGIPASNIAKWDGNEWSALGSGTEDLIFTIAASGNNVYAGGIFLNNGIVTPTSYLAKWDGNTWSSLGSGVDGWVLALATVGTDLYVGGAGFSHAGGTTAENIAKWDGSTWSALGSGVNSEVTSFVTSGDDLYVGGSFWEAGGRPAKFIAKWSDRSWSALGSGITGNNPAWVNTLVVSGSDLYVGGNFFRAGKKRTSHIARAFLEGVPELSVVNGHAIVYFRIPSGNYGIERSTDLETWTHLETKLVEPVGGFEFRDAEAPQSGAFYRAVPEKP